MSAVDVPPTELVAGKYRLTRLLGRGGMGSVWEGLHDSLGTRVAVKFIESDFANSAEAVQRFENEARAAAKLSTKHVVAVHDHGLLADGRPYIVMEYLAGEPLDQRLARVGRLSMAETAQIVVHVARALSRAHDVGIVHRDLKPENIFLVVDEEDGTEVAKVVDFGIAKFTDKSSGLSSSTKTGAILGTPYFMSPEQARGLRSVDYRSDLWSLAVIAFRCMVGQLPFSGEAVGDLLVRICTAPVPVPSQLVPGTPPAFDAWIARALAREPEGRFQSATEMADALAAIAGLPVAARSAALASSPNASAVTQGAMPTPVTGPGVTAAPFTQSTQFTQSRKSPVVLIAAVLGAVALVGVVLVGIVVAKAMSSPAEAPEVIAAAGVESVESPAPSASAEPSVAPAVEVPATASAEPAAAPEASAAPEPVAAKPAISKPTTTKPPTTKPTTTKPTTTKPTTTSKPDIGY